MFPNVIVVEEKYMANVISDETMEYVGILAKLELSDAEKEAAKKAEEARIACIKIDENAKKKLAELKKMEEKQGE